MLKLCGALLVLVVTTFGDPFPERCKILIERRGMSANFNETIAHAIHSMTVQGLRVFNSKASVYNNNVPTINEDMGSPIKVLPNAPDDHVGSDFATSAMNEMDHIFQNLGKGSGPHWTAIGKVVHTFHMRDFWEEIRRSYLERVIPYPPSEDLCYCLTDTVNNGINKALEYSASLYEKIAALIEVDPMQGLASAESWSVWKKRLLYFYNSTAFYDTANYLFCATRDF